MARAASRVPAARSDELGGDVVDADVVGEVAGGEPEQEPAVLHPQRVHRLARPAAVATGRRVVGVGADRRAAGRPRTANAAGRVRAERRVGELAPVLGVPEQVVAERGAGAEHRTAAASRCPRRRRARSSSASPVLDPLGERQPARRAAWSGSAVAAEDAPAAARPASPSRSSVGERALGVLEAEPDQLALGLTGRSPASSSAPAQRGEARRPAAASVASSSVARRRRSSASTASRSMPALDVRRRGRSSAHAPDDRPRPPRGGTARPRRVGANRAACSSPSGRAREHDGARRAGR